MVNADIVAVRSVLRPRLPSRREDLLDEIEVLRSKLAAVELENEALKAAAAAAVVVDETPLSPGVQRAKRLMEEGVISAVEFKTIAEKDAHFHEFL